MNGIVLFLGVMKVILTFILLYLIYDKHGWLMSFAISYIIFGMFLHDVTLQSFKRKIDYLYNNWRKENL